jgi:hypothetical protein
MLAAESRPSFRLSEHPRLSAVRSDKGKPVERRGRKATGLRTQVYGSGVATLSRYIRVRCNSFSCLASSGRIDSGERYGTDDEERGRSSASDRSLYRHRRVHADPLPSRSTYLNPTASKPATRAVQVLHESQPAYGRQPASAFAHGLLRNTRRCRKVATSPAPPISNSHCNPHASRTVASARPGHAGATLCCETTGGGATSTSWNPAGRGSHTDRYASATDPRNACPAQPSR